LGELLRETFHRGGDRKSKSHEGALKAGGIPDGVSKNQSRRWQKVASIVEPVFEQKVAETRAD
jgi:hypothetical protein